ncbi:MAG: cyclic nucleotide-binding domain-containing protein, partial [Chloroflexota bacterium]|nr:cyclic nucleotide-binding domain-containing protein [Chloroflexota bacterium]
MVDTTAARELVGVLRRVPLLAGLPDEQLAWIADRGTEVRLGPGERIAREGDPADGFYVVLEGETEWTKRVGGHDAYVVTLGPGTIFAELILLLDAPYPTSGRAVTPVRLLKLAPDAFWELLMVCRQVLRGIVAIAAERSELHATVSQQGAKLISLGTMAAGLAHELNNPAAAVGRGAKNLHATFAGLSARALALGQRGLTPEQREFVAGLPREVAARARDGGSARLD